VSSASPRPIAATVSLVWLIIAVVPCFAFTAALTKFHRQQQSAIAARWTHRGEEALAAGRAADAVEDFRSALNYSRDDASLRLRLARALAATDRRAEARGYLLTLWEDAPGDGPVNLELGRLAVRDGDLQEATRYYHAAIEGAWDQDAERRRRASRIELGQLLVRAGDTTRARPELLALEGDLPDDADGQRRIAELLASAGMASESLAAFKHVLAEHPRDVTALAGAGRAAFALHDYTAAASYLGGAIEQGETAPDVSRDQETAAMILQLDPYRRGLTRAERIRRAAAAYTVALERLTACARAQADNQELAAERTAAERESRNLVRRLQRDPDALDDVMERALAIEEHTAQTCGSPSAADRALQLLAAGRSAGR
jgi:tetratricopeptide (TPR) repeat protein